MPLNNFNWDVSSGLAQGISQAGQGLARGIEQMTGNLKKAKAYRTMAVDGLGMEPEAVDKMPLEELEGHFQAMAVKSAMEGQKQKRQAMQQEQDYNAEIARMMQPGIQPDQPAGMIMADGGSPMPGEQGPESGVPAFSPQDMMRAAARHGQLSPEIALKFMAGAGKTPKTLQFMKDPAGADIALSPDTGAFQYSPYSKAEAQAKLQPRDALKTYNDNQERMSKLKQNLKLTSDPETAKYFDADAIHAELADLEAQQAELRPVFGGKGKAKEAAPAGEPKANVSQAEYEKLKSGDLYWWNGKQLKKK